jgi:hypothetical protein
MQAPGKLTGNPQTVRTSFPKYTEQISAKQFQQAIFGKQAQLRYENSFAKAGKPRIAHIHAKITTPRKRSEWSALGKPVAPPTETAECFDSEYCYSEYFRFWSWR